MVLTEKLAGSKRLKPALKLRPLAHVNVYEGDYAGFAKNTIRGTDHPLALLGLPPTLLFMRVHNNSLLLSKLQNAEPKQCTKVISFAALKAVHQLSKHAFEIVLLGAPPIRLEAHDAFVSAQHLNPPILLLLLLLLLDHHQSAF